MADDVVDVLIVGAGASGAAVAWSLAETRMRIVCLEQGGWMNPAEYPSNGRDWEARAAKEMQVSPNLRKRPADYPINDDDSPIAILNFNAVGGSTILYSAHFPRFHPSDFRVKTLDGVADDWPIDYAHAGTLLRRERQQHRGCRAGRGSAIPPISRRCRTSRWAAWARPWAGASTSSAGTGGRPTAPSSPVRTTAAASA